MEESPVFSLATGHHFISYSAADGRDFALRLVQALETGPDSPRLWFDVRDLRPGIDWDEQLAEAIRTCESLIFVMTIDSVEALSVCKQEWTRALKYKKPIIPILCDRNAELPFRLEPRQNIDFTGDFDPPLKKLRDHLHWLRSPAGVLLSLQDRLSDARRDFRRASDPAEQARIQSEINLLQSQIVEQQQIVNDPLEAAQRAKESIARGLERERKPEKPASGITHSKFINPPPGVAPNYFQDRRLELQLIGDFLKDESKRLMMVVGRAGVGKTAMVCLLLKSLEGGHLPYDGGPLRVGGIVYLSAVGTRRVNTHNLWADLCSLLPDSNLQEFEALYKNPHMSMEAKMRSLLAAFPLPPSLLTKGEGTVILLLDNFEDLVDTATLALKDPELDQALRALLNAPPHAVKVIITTRLAPRELLLVQPGKQARLELDAGLESPYAENILREMDSDGKLKLRSASPELLAEARDYTRGYPRALEALFAILSADRHTSLRDVLDSPPPENVVEALVGEAFNRLDSIAEKVMQALAVYARPATPAAVDYLLQPFQPAMNSAPVLNRLVNMQFARREAGRYYLHPVDRAYAFGRLPAGEEADRHKVNEPIWTQFALLHRGAEYFRQARKPREDWKSLDDLAPQLAEFDLRYKGRDYDTAALVLLEIDFNPLLIWGYYQLVAELHQRLDSKLSDPYLKQLSLGRLGNAYTSLGRYPQAITCFEQALAIAHERGDRDEEESILSQLGWCHGQIGQTIKAIYYSEQALAIARERGDRAGEESALGNLGWYYGKLGETDHAIDFSIQALTVAREIKDRVAEGAILSNLAGLSNDKGKYEEAMEYARESIKIGIDLRTPILRNWSNGFLALAHLYMGDLVSARAAAEEARRHDEPENNPSVLGLLGLIALRQEDRGAAQEAFTVAIDQADSLLAYTAQNYEALDTRGLALCGLVFVGTDSRPAHANVEDAVIAYRGARAINKDKGVVSRVLRLFDALEEVDVESVLVDARKAAAGEPN